jgi:hypothetical protein
MTVNEILKTLNEKQFKDAPGTHIFYFSTDEIRRDSDFLTNYTLLDNGNRVIINCPKIYTNSLIGINITLKDSSEILLYFESTEPTFWVSLTEV